nr:MAG TPA: hypothetical protein [Caudoviricetes sp.]
MSSLRFYALFSCRLYILIKMIETIFILLTN